MTPRGPTEAVKATVLGSPSCIHVLPRRWAAEEESLREGTWKSKTLGQAARTRARRKPQTKAKTKEGMLDGPQ